MLDTKSEKRLFWKRHIDDIIDVTDFTHANLKAIEFKIGNVKI
jgi:hypothetical protein